MNIDDDDDPQSKIKYEPSPLPTTLSPSSFLPDSPPQSRKRPIRDELSDDTSTDEEVGDKDSMCMN